MTEFYDPYKGVEYACAQERQAVATEQTIMQELITNGPDTSSNPKDTIGDTKVPVHLFPPIAVAYGAMGMLEGKEKYGYVNYRATDVVASIYVAAAIRHLSAWLEGEELSTDTGNPHLGNALATIAIVVDAFVNGSLIDDRPILPNGVVYSKEMERLRAQVENLKKQFKDKKPKHYYQSEAPNKE